MEDMHWADRSTRAFTVFLSRTLRQERVCVILTYRADELHRRHPLRPLLSELERLERARRILLEPFDRAELGEALADILGAAPDGALLDRLFTRSEGNPLFTEELLAAGLDGRGAAPQSLRDAFLVRIERLSPDAQRVARAVAVARAADETMLAAVTGLDRTVLLDALRESVSEQVLVAGADGSFGFRHALLREALYDDLLPGERGELHIALARELEQRCGADDDRELERASAIAAHYAAAGDQPHALRGVIAAARGRAQGLRLRRGRGLHGARAGAVAARRRPGEGGRPGPRDPADDGRQGSPDHGRADAQHRAHQGGAARARSRDPAGPVRGAAGPAGADHLVAERRGGGAGDRRARAGDAPRGRSGRRAAAAAGLAGAHAYLRGRFHHAATEGEAAIKVAIEAGDRMAETELLNTLGMAYVSLGEVDKGVKSLQHAIELARENDDFDSLSTAYSNLADMFELAGRTRQALETAKAGFAATPSHHVRSYLWIRVNLAQMSFEAGEWEPPRRRCRPRPLEAPDCLFIFRQLTGAMVELGIGDEDAAEACLDAAKDLVAVTSEPQWISLYGATRAELLIRRRDLAGAQRAVQDALDRLETCTDDVMGIARISCVGMRVEAERALRARDLREPADRRDALARARLHVDRLTAAAQDGGPVERARLAQGKAEMARARGRAGAKEWRRAAQAWEEIERPYPVACARWREAEALAAADDRAGAAQAASAALVVAEELGPSGWCARCARSPSGRAWTSAVWRRARRPRRARRRAGGVERARGHVRRRPTRPTRSA